jgi:hypothetical protein
MVHVSLVECTGKVKFPVLTDIQGQFKLCVDMVSLGLASNGSSE